MKNYYIIIQRIKIKEGMMVKKLGAVKKRNYLRKKHFSNCFEVTGFECSFI